MYFHEEKTASCNQDVGNDWQRLKEWIRERKGYVLANGYKGSSVVLNCVLNQMNVIEKSEQSHKN